MENYTKSTTDISIWTPWFIVWFVLVIIVVIAVIYCLAKAAPAIKERRKLMLYAKCMPCILKVKEIKYYPKEEVDLKKVLCEECNKDYGRV